MRGVLTVLDDDGIFVCQVGARRGSAPGDGGLQPYRGAAFIRVMEARHGPTARPRSRWRVGSGGGAAYDTACLTRAHAHTRARTYARRIFGTQVQNFELLVEGSQYDWVRARAHTHSHASAHARTLTRACA